MFLAFQLVQISHLMDDWHESFLGWRKFDSMVDHEWSIKKCDNIIRPHTCDYNSRHQSGLFHFTMLSGLFVELLAARF